MRSPVKPQKMWTKSKNGYHNIINKKINIDYFTTSCQCTANNEYACM